MNVVLSDAIPTCFQVSSEREGIDGGEQTSLIVYSSF
jgi:hypothetical protein